jgi:adenylate cyclase
MCFALLARMSTTKAEPDIQRLGGILLDAMNTRAERLGLAGVIDAIRITLAAAGIEPERIQLPLTRALGFRDATVGVLLLTWTGEEGYVERPISHERMNALDAPGPVGSPYESVVMDKVPLVHHDLSKPDLSYTILQDLAAEGYRDYLVVGLRLPGNESPQALSIAAKTPFPEYVSSRLLALVPLFSLAVYSVYRTSQAKRIAHLYIGKESGPQVLDGDVERGHTRRIQAGILFCDIRNFTHMSELHSAEYVVALVNDVFQIVGEEVDARGGEILKFIGDAMLVEFRVFDDGAEVAQRMVQSVRAALSRVRNLSERLESPVGIGFGGHIGEVVQGNIGTTERLDFTIMGAAVNLASRLEGQCKAFGVDAVFSDAVAAHVELQEIGVRELKGVQTPQKLWTLVA